MTAMSNHTENNYIGSNDTDPNTNDNNNSNNIPGTNTSNEESTLMETEEFESDDAANVHVRKKCIMNRRSFSRSDFSINTFFLLISNTNILL